MPRTRTRSVESYNHKGKQRADNPQVGLVTAQTDPDLGKQRTYAYDPNLDPQLTWAGKAEHTSFDVPTVSLHVHERIDPRTIIKAVQRDQAPETATQLGLFETTSENPPLREAVEFYKHAHDWSSRLIAGDSLLVMNSLLEKEGMAGKVQMVYIDPPYGIKYGSNFQPFINKREVKDGDDEDLTTEPEQIRAFRDTWELGIHSYLTYLRDRLLLAKDLLTETGSIFVQINDTNVHHVREIMDEVFGTEQFVALIFFKTATNQNAKRIQRLYDILVWYGKSKEVKFRHLYRPRTLDEIENTFNYRDTTTGERYKSAEISSEYTEEQLNRLRIAGRLVSSGKYAKRFPTDFPYTEIDNAWWGTIISTFSKEKVYAVQTSTEAIKRAILMTTDPGDLIFDPTCGSGTTAIVAEQWGRRWITCDTSRVAITLAKQRLMTAVFDYYSLSHPNEGVGSGFTYKKVPHITITSIANNTELHIGKSPTEIEGIISRNADQESIYDQPIVDSTFVRVTGPFTVEAVPAQYVKSIDELLSSQPVPADASISRSGETLRQSEWRDALLQSGIRAKNGQYIRFSRLEPLPACRWLNAEGENRLSDEGSISVREHGTAEIVQRIVVSFGPEHAPMEQRQVEQAIQEAQTLIPKPTLVVFAAFQFDPEAAKDIDETNWPGVTLLKVQMNADLQTADLKKKSSSNESFWLIGQPDVLLEKLTEGPNVGMYQVTVNGFDYYNTRTGNVESGGSDRVAVWMLDTDYDGRSVYPRQVFFPMAGNDEGWSRLARTLRAEINEDRIEMYRGKVSLPFKPGNHKCIAVKIVDDRGIESLRVMEVN